MDSVSSVTLRDDHPPYTYSPLTDPEADIRLLTLLPSKHHSDRIRATLKVENRESGAQYEALSYTWGELTTSYLITIDGLDFYVTDNLFAALNQLRSRTEPRTLWIDAICINQNDDVEKSHQVRSMNLIYKNASCVLVWLGEASEDSDLAIQNIIRIGILLMPSLMFRVGQIKEEDINATWVVKTVSESPVFDLVSQYDDDASRVLNEVYCKDLSWLRDGPLHLDMVISKPAQVAISQFANRNWWRRLWIKQEFCFAKNLNFHCGDNSFSFELFYPGFFTASMFFNRAMEQFEDVSFPMNYLSMLFLFYLRDEGGTSFIAKEKLITVLHSSRTAHCTDDRDKIFAVLNLAQDEVVSLIKIDYGLSTANVYTQVAKAFLTSQQSLDILHCCSWNPPNINRVAINLPSWVPNWAPSEDFPLSTIKVEQQLPNPVFKASLGLKYNISLMDDALHQGVLRVEGFRLDTVSETGEVALRKTLVKAFVSTMRKWEKLAIKVNMTSEAFWLTVTAEMFVDGNGERLSPEDKVMFRNFSYRWTSENSNPEMWLTDPEFSKILDRISSPGGRRLFITNAGFMGLGAEGVNVGDVVCILFGGQAPFVLRTQEDGRYTLVGECYVHGVMDGETMTGLERGDYKKEIFQIV